MRDRQEAVERISSLKWERVCLQKRNDFTIYLHKNYTRQYQKWNDVVDEIKAIYLDEIVRKVTIGLTKKELLLKAVNCFPSSRQLKKYKFFLPVDYLLAVFLLGHGPVLH